MLPAAVADGAARAARAAYQTSGFGKRNGRRTGAAEKRTDAFAGYAGGGEQQIKQGAFPRRDIYGGK